MNRLQSITENLYRIRESEGPDFKFQEDRIAADILKYEADHSSLIIRIITFIGAQMASSFLFPFFL